MRCTVHFYKLNYDFSPEYAEAHHGGAASPNNRRYDWEDELAVKTDVVTYDVKEGASYILEGERSGAPFAETLEKMIRFEFTDSEGKMTVMACSHSIVESYEVKEVDGNLEVEVYFEEREPLTNPVPGIYVAVQEFPKSLI